MTKPLLGQENNLTAYCHHCGAMDSIHEVVQVNEVFRVDFTRGEYGLVSEQWGEPVADSPFRGNPEPLYYVCSQCNRTVDEEKLRFVPITGSE